MHTNAHSKKPENRSSGFINRPNFFVIGAAKCASSSFCGLLGHHPEIFMCSPKEPRFFSRDEKYEKGFDWYQSLYADATGNKAIGEGSVCYGNPVRFKNVVDRVIEFSPDAKLIYMVRHPLKRIESDWEIRMHEGWGAVASLKESLHSHPDIFAHSLYWRQLDAWRQRVPDERILVIFFEEFIVNPQAQLRRGFEHLEVDADVDLGEDVHRARNSSLNYKDKLFPLRLVESSSVISAVSRVLPAQFRKTLRKRLIRKKTYQAIWDEESIEFAVSEVREDCKQLLAYANQPQEYWDYFSVG